MFVVSYYHSQIVARFSGFPVVRALTTRAPVYTNRAFKLDPLN